MSVDATTIARVRTRYRKTQARWGFSWALWCAILWGAWYIPGTAIFYEDPIAGLSGNNGEIILGALIVSMLNAVAVLVAMFFWLVVLGKTREYVATIRRPRISAWYIPAGFCGFMAIIGIYLAITFVGPAFGSVAGLLFPLAGVTIARLWLKERITLRGATGILVMVCGAFIVFVPGLWEQLTTPGDNAWIGYVGGLLTIIGFGAEGAVAGRALDVSDPEIGATLRFTAELGLWLLVLFPLMLLIWGYAALDALVVAVTNPTILFLLVPLGLTYGYCYLTWYKSFPLIGVGPGQAIATLSGPIAIILLWIFSVSVIGWNVVLGCVIAVAGSFVLFSERSSGAATLRHEHVPHPEPPAVTGVSQKHQPELAAGERTKPRHLKGIALEELARRGPLWDYEIVDTVMDEHGVSGRYWAGTVRATLTDLFAGGLIAEVGVDVDPARSFGEEKILHRFELTDFGRLRMRQAGLREGNASA